MDPLIWSFLLYKVVNDTGDTNVAMETFQAINLNAFHLHFPLKTVKFNCKITPRKEQGRKCTERGEELSKIVFLEPTIVSIYFPYDSK